MYVTIAKIERVSRRCELLKNSIILISDAKAIDSMLTHSHSN